MFDFMNQELTIVLASNKKVTFDDFQGFEKANPMKKNYFSE